MALAIQARPLAMVAGLVVVGVVLGLFFLEKGVTLEGQILKVRTLAVEEKNTIVVVDFRFVNPSDKNPFWVRSVEVILDDKSGKPVTGTTVAESDARRLFEYYPTLGQKFNDSLILRDKIAPGTTADRMIAASFDLPETDVQARQNLTLRITDVDGPVAEIREKAK